MKKLSCDQCDAIAHGETFAEWMKNLQPHYMSVHREFVELQALQSKERQNELQQQWMEENKKKIRRSSIRKCVAHDL